MPASPALLVLADGSVFSGRSFGSAVHGHGEVVFATAMTGYQEMLTDPSFAGQVLVLTYPLAGNYGINGADVESRRIQVSGLVVREACETPSHWQSEMTLAQYLASEGVPGIQGIDTRALTRKLRSHGVLMGTITTDETADVALARLRSLPSYDSTDFVRSVSTLASYEWEHQGEPSKHIALLDAGVKYNILRLLQQRGCRVTVLPCDATTEDVLSLQADGVVISPGPGDPALLDYMVQTARGLIGKTPLLGICLGHQVIGRAFGAKTYKLPFGHRGANHPVRDLATGRVHITAQNHGYALDAGGLRDGLEVAQVHLNDGTVEGLRHRDLPILTIQYHSEASPGPLDNVYVFDRFLEMMRINGV